MERVEWPKSDGRTLSLHLRPVGKVSRHKEERGELPDLHANPAKTASVYDRMKVVKRDALGAEYSHGGNSEGEKTTKPG